MNGNIFVRITRATVAAALVTFTALAAARAQEPERLAAIAPQPLVRALDELAARTGVQVVYRPEVAEGIRTRGAESGLSLEATIDQLLRGTGLEYEFINPRTVAIRRVSGGRRSSSAASAQAPVRIAAEQGSTRPAAGSPMPVDPSPQAAEPSDLPRPGEISLGEIVVTGTNIRGSVPAGSHVVVIDRESIEASGYTTAAEVVQALPQNFGGNFSQDVNFADTGNTSGASGIDLRGLGPDATLVLVNGRRRPSTDFRGNFTDISTIPLSAVERIEVLAEGASAIYGSDAVGGVVNFILRDRADATNVGVRHGRVTEGSLRETRVSASTGLDWAGGNAFGAYEYYDREPLMTSERRFARSEDLRPFGGSDFRSTRANPGTINVAGVGTFAIPAGQDGTNLRESDLVPGTRNFGNHTEGLQLVPGQELHALYLGAEHRILPRVQLFADARYSRREFHAVLAHQQTTFTVPATNAFRAMNGLFPGRTMTVDYDFRHDIPIRSDGGVVQTGDAVLGAELSSGDSWRIQAFATYAWENLNRKVPNFLRTPVLNAALADPDPATAFNPFADGSNTNPATLRAISSGFTNGDLVGDVWSGRLSADGNLFELPAGPLKLAVGTDYRAERFSNYSWQFVNTPAPVGEYRTKNRRDVLGAFVEFNVPVTTRDSAIGAIDLALASRWDDYSDVGETVNPKLGLSWSPVRAVTLRGSYGRSFRAPNLSDLDQEGTLARREVRLLNITDPGSPAGRSDAILILGGNPDLREQTAETWTAGLRFAPDLGGRPSVDLGYFDVSFRDRISSITGVVAALTPGSEFESAVDRTPDLDFVAGLLAEVQTPIGSITPADVDVIVDIRPRNLAITDVRGIDLSARWSPGFAGGSLDLSLEASRILDFDKAGSPASEPVSVVDTLLNPVDFRGRLGLGWRMRAFTTHVFVNYVDDYRDHISVPDRRIDSWTTVDLRAQLPLVFATGPVDELTLGLSVLNALDEAPPFANNSSGLANMGFDPANADPIGRLVALELTARF